jgi:hypothetical protein
MTDIVIYSALAFLIVILTALLVRQRRDDQVTETESERDCAQGVWDMSCLNLAERIFDSSDYFWLRDKVGFPHLARTLARSRQQTALRWLKALRSSFEEMIRVPEPVPHNSPPGDLPRNWELLWLTLRFHLVWSYALLVVRLFGPYNRLVPSLNWRQILPASSSRERRYGTVDLENLP